MSYLSHLNSVIPLLQDFRILRRQKACFDNWMTRNPDFSISRFLNIPTSWYPNFSISRYLDFSISRFLDIPISRYPDFSLYGLFYVVRISNLVYICFDVQALHYRTLDTWILDVWILSLPWYPESAPEYHCISISPFDCLTPINYWMICRDYWIITILSWVGRFIGRQF